MSLLRERYQHELNELQRELMALGDLCVQALRRALWALREGSVATAQAVIADDDQIDAAAEQVTQHATRVIATQGPVAGDLRLVSAFMRCADELERIGDYAEGIARVVVRLNGPSPLGLPTLLLSMADDAGAMLEHAVVGLSNRDPQINQKLQSEDDRLDEGYEQLFAALTSIMQHDPDQVETGTYLLWVGHNLERIGDRATNIGEHIEYIVRGRVSSR